MRSRISSDWQSFRRFGDEAEGFDLVTRVNRLRGARGKMTCDAVGRQIESPKTNVKQLEGVEEFQRLGTTMDRQDHNRNVREEAIAMGLLKRFAPVAQLAFESADDGFCMAYKVLNLRRRRRILPGRGIPIHRHTVGDSVTVHGDLARHRCVGSGRPMMQNLVLGAVNPRESQNHPLFGASPSGMVRQVANWFAEPELWNQCCAFSDHTGNLDHSVEFASYFACLGRLRQVSVKG